MTEAKHRTLLHCVAMAVAVACLAPGSVARSEGLKGLTIEGDKFTFEEGKLVFRGVLLKPEGKGPFPAVLISHGLGSNAERFGRMKAKEFLKWGFVCIAPNYAHGDAQSDRRDFGASEENIRRAKKCLDILQAQPEVDPKRLCAYGNSMGAFVTIGLAADEQDRLVAAAITAGGISSVGGFAAPSKNRAAKVKTPFLILHGSKDTTVPPEQSRLLAEVLKERKTPVRAARVRRCRARPAHRQGRGG